MTDSARIVVVDNYDSFVYTIVGYLKTLGATVDVVRNDAIDPSDASVLDEYDGVLISPGPGAPADSGASEDVIRLCAKLGKPMFGVCLGLQALAEVFGCTVSHAPTIMHGKTSLVEHIDDEIFAGVANPMTATRYHSLAVEPDTVPDDLVVTAWTKDDHIVQGIKHRSLPMYAVQFHPESVMTQDGYRLLANWLAVCGQTNAVANMLFGAISGSGTAAASAMGSIIGPIEEEEGYDRDFSAAANIATAPTGLLIPPSNVMITFSLVSGGTSVAALFMAGYIPGILWGLACMIVIYYFAKKKGYKSSAKYTASEKVKVFFQAIPCLLMIIVVIGGIISGIFTA